jgi:hypothetical protein
MATASFCKIFIGSSLNTPINELLLIANPEDTPRISGQLKRLFWQPAQISAPFTSLIGKFYPIRGHRKHRTIKGQPYLRLDTGFLPVSPPPCQPSRLKRHAFFTMGLVKGETGKVAILPLCAPPIAD